MDKTTKKMIKNYIPFVFFESNKNFLKIDLTK
jgi:hypothetical protein